MLARPLSSLMAWSLLLLMALLPLEAHSDVDCQNVFNRKFKSDTFYVIAFLGRERIPSDPQQRSAKLGELEGRISPRLQDFVYKMSEQLPDAPPLIIFLTCDAVVSVDDLSLREIETLARRNVISALWASTEGSMSAITQLSLPHFQRRPQAHRRQIEIAWKMLSLAATVSVDDWIVELDRDSVAQQALLAMNVGFMALKASQLPLAKRSLCQVRVNLKLMSAEIVRPATQDLQRTVAALIADVITEIDTAAGQRGINLDANASVRLACSQ